MVIDMIYDHLVKHNGIYYQAGEEVPEEQEPLFSEEQEPLFSEEINDSDITFETDAVDTTKTSARKGRTKKTE